MLKVRGLSIKPRSSTICIDLSMHVHVVKDYNINFCIVLLCSLHGPGPGPVLCMIRERHVILKSSAPFWASCLAAASYIIMLYCPVYSFYKFILVYSFKN